MEELFIIDFTNLDLISFDNRCHDFWIIMNIENTFSQFIRYARN